MTYHHSKHETCIVMDGTCMYNCPTFFLFWKCLDDMSYWTNLYPTVADNELHFFTILNLNYTVFVSLAHIYAKYCYSKCIIGDFCQICMFYLNPQFSYTAALLMSETQSMHNMFISKYMLIEYIYLTPMVSLTTRLPLNLYITCVY